MTLDTIVAVVLAGGVKAFSFREFWHQLEDLFSYREWYFRRGYKSLKKIKATRGLAGKVWRAYYPKMGAEFFLKSHSDFIHR